MQDPGSKTDGYDPGFRTQDGAGPPKKLGEDLLAMYGTTLRTCLIAHIGYSACKYALCSITHQAPLTTHHSSLITYYSSLITHNSSLITHHSPLITHQSPITNHQSSLMWPLQHAIPLICESIALITHMPSVQHITHHSYAL